MRQAFVLGKLPKGSRCQESKRVPARSSYWRDETNEVERCARYATGRGGKRDRKKKRDSDDDSASDGTDPDDVDIPESIGAYDLTESQVKPEGRSLARYQAEGAWAGGFPPSLPRDERLTIEVQAANHGGKAHNRKASADVRYWVGDKEGTPDEQSRISTRQGFSGGPIKGFERALEKAVEWMKEHQPADVPDDADDGTPDDVNGWERVTNEDNKKEWEAWYAPNRHYPTAVKRRVTVRQVTVHKKKGKRWSVGGKYVNPDGDTFGSIRYDAWRSGTSSQRWRELEPALEAAVEYMEENDPEKVEYTDMPRFRLRFGNDTAKPLFKVLERHAPENLSKYERRYTAGEIDTDGAFDLVGTDAANVAMYELSLLFGAAESARVERDGDAFAFDGHRLAQVSTDGKMGDELVLRTEYSDQQNVAPTLVAELGGVTRGVPMLPDVEGTRPDIPDIPIGATFTVKEANTFKKAVRFGQQVGDVGAIVAEDDGARLIAEGGGERRRAELADTARVTADDRDRAVGFFSLDYLRGFTMDVPRPASTEIDVQMTTPEGFTDEQTGNTGPMIFSWDSRGAMVKLWLAPRVRGRDGNDPEDWDLSAPAATLPCDSDREPAPVTVCENDRVPPLVGTNTDGERVTARASKGDTVAWFFPKQPGCRCGAQAVAFDRLQAEQGATVVGVSTADVDTLKEFEERHDLGITLLSDPEGENADAWGVPVSDGMYERTAFFVRDGRVTERVDGTALNVAHNPDPTETVALGAHEKSTPEILESFEHPSVAVITGKRGSGKSSLAFKIADDLHKREGRIPVLVGGPDGLEEHLPDYFQTANDLNETPCNAVCVVDEAYIRYHSRRAMTDENLTMSKLVNTSRHHNQSILFVVQNSGQLDRNAVSEADLLFMKEPGTLHSRFERKKVQDLSAEAKAAFDQLPADVDRREYTYVFADGKEKLVETTEAPFYGDRLSKSYGAVCESYDPEVAQPENVELCRPERLQIDAETFRLAVELEQAQSSN